MGNTYFFKLLKHNKFLFILVFGFISGQLFFTYKQVETVPFFNYGMYSENCFPQKTYPTLAIYDKGERIALDQLIGSPVFLEYQLRTYAKLITQDSMDYVHNTIESRFGKGTIFSNYLIKYLTNNKRSISEFPVWIENWVDRSNLTIKIENYQRLNNSFEIVNSKTLH